MAVTDDAGGGGAPLPDEPNEGMAAMLQHVSDSAARGGGRVIDVGQMLRGYEGDSTFGEQEFEERSGIEVDSLVEAVRAAAEAEGVDVSDSTVSLQIVDEVEQGSGNAGGWTEGDRAWVKDWQGEESSFGDTDEWTAENVLHEAAHALVFQSDDVEDEDVHGPMWQRVYLGAVRSAFPEKYEEEAERIPSRYADSEADEGH